MNSEKLQYQTEYENFLKEYSSGTTTGEGVGAVIARLSQYFTEANLDQATALINFNNKATEIEERIDDNGKAISSAKAKVFADSSEESAVLIRTKVHLSNIEQDINALKSLQKGIMSEWSQGNL
jgi:hypothetical protein